MNHSRVRARLNDFLERDLSPAERSAIRAHLDGCGDCARELRELEQTVGLLRGMPEPDLPLAFTATVMARVRSGEAEPVGLLHWLRRLFEPGVAIPLVAGLSSLVFFAGLESGSFQSPAAPSASQPIQLADASLDRMQPMLGVNEATAAPTVTRAPLPPRRMQQTRWAPRGNHRAMVAALRGAGHPHSARMASLLEEPLEPELLQLPLTTVSLER